MLNASLYYDRRHKTKKGYPLKVRFLIEGQYYYSKSILYVDPEKWDDKSDLPKDRFDYQFVLKKKASLVNEELFCVNNKLTPAECKVVFEKGVSEPESKEIEIAKLKERIRELEMGQDQPFEDVFNQYLARLTKDASSVLMRTSVKRFLNFTPNISINKINTELCKDFVWFLQSQGLKNGIYAYMSHLGLLYAWAKGKRVENPFYETMPKMLEQKKKTPLTKSDIVLLEKYTSENTNRTLRVKIFLLQFYFGGIDLIDLGLLTYSKNYKRGRISFKRYKSRNKRNGGATIDIKVFPKAQDILNEFKSGDRLVPVIPNPIINSKINRKYNIFLVGNNAPLRTAAKEIGIDETISSKVSRNTFKTIGRKELKLDNEIIKQIQGHSLTGIDKRYQDDFDYDSQDEVHSKVIN
jgi:hypothetical protein